MLKSKKFLRKKSVQFTVFGAVLALFLVMISFSYSYSVSAAAPGGGFGVGRNQGVETGINTDAFNKVRADVNAGMYDRPCQPDESDPNKWHSLVNVEKKCHYDHQHNDDPNYVNDIFGVPGAWFGSPGMEISYPWQTFKAATALEGNSTYMANHQMENDLKHEGYVWIVRRDQPCPNGNCVKDFRIQVHTIMGAADMPVRFHSFSLEARLCVNGNDPSTCGIVRYGGWIDMGRLFTTKPNDVNCEHNVVDVPIALPADTLYFPLDRPDSRDEIRCHPQITTLPPYPPTKPLAEWWGHAGGETRFQVRAYDPIGNVDPANPAHWQFFCSQTDMNCHYDASMFSVFVGYTLQISEFVGGTGGTIHVPVDANGDGRADFKGYFNRWGDINQSCTAPGLDCVPYQYDNVPLNFGGKEARYVQTNCTNCKPVDYDISPPGKRWITWFYRYADGGVQPTPVPTNPAPSTPVPSMPAPTQVPPTVPAVVVNVSPANATANATVNVSLGLYNVQNVYGLQTTCNVDPKVLLGGKRGDGDVFNSSNSFFADKGFQADGTWVVGASRLQPNPVFAGNGVAFKLSFTVKQIAQTAVTCKALAVDANGKEVPLKIVNGSFNGGASAAGAQANSAPTEVAVVTQPTDPAVMELGTPVPTEVTDGTPQADAIVSAAVSSTVTGKIVYQNHPDNSNITVQLLNSTGKVVATMKTGVDGSYIFKNVPVGTSGVTAVADLSLRIGKIVIVSKAGQNVNMGSLTLPGGDTDNSGDITLADASLVGANFDNKVNPSPAAADINGDGVINIRDLAIIGGNFGLKGPIIIK